MIYVFTADTNQLRDGFSGHILSSSGASPAQCPFLGLLLGDMALSPSVLDRSFFLTYDFIKEKQNHTHTAHMESGSWFLKCFINMNIN